MSGMIRNKTIYDWFTQQGGQRFLHVICSRCDMTPPINRRYVRETHQSTVMRGDDEVKWFCAKCAAAKGIVDPKLPKEERE